MRQLVPARPRRSWTRDTRFGAWFQGTSVWQRYVVSLALDEFEHLLGEPLGRGMVVLDAGCGSGSAFPDLVARFRPDRLLAVDIDPRQLARAHAVAARCPGSIEVQCSDLRCLGVRSESIDLVLCHQVLHHVAEQGTVLRELFRVLRPGGLLLLAESCRSFVRSLPVRLLFRHPDSQRTADGYLQLVRENGFVFGAAEASRPDPLWARPDFGLLQALGMPPVARAESPEVQVVAHRPVTGCAAA